MTEWVYTCNSGNRNKVYHTNQNCTVLDSSGFKRKLRNLPDDYEQCQYCSGEATRGTSGAFTAGEEGWTKLQEMDPDEI